MEQEDWTDNIKPVLTLILLIFSIVILVIEFKYSNDLEKYRP